MELSVGPLKIHAIATGEVHENDNGSIEVFVQERGGSWKGKLLLNADDAKILRKHFCGTRRIH